MALPSFGSISLSQIQGEFGGAAPISLSEYYKGGAYTSTSASIPTSGTIAMSQFRGAAKSVSSTWDRTASGTVSYTVPAYNSLTVQIWGAGGGGGVGDFNGSDGATGNNGGNSTAFGQTAGGGKGGAHGPKPAQGGAGGTGTTPGQDGGDGTNTTTDNFTYSAYSGNGGNSGGGSTGGTGKRVSPAQLASNGNNYGGGGGGTYQGFGQSTNGPGYALGGGGGGGGGYTVKTWTSGQAGAPSPGSTYTIVVGAGGTGGTAGGATAGKGGVGRVRITTS